jgi:hypothetical protein
MKRAPLPRYEEEQRSRAYRTLLAWGFTRWPEHGSAPDWACRLAYLEHCGARHFELLPWPRIWQKAAKDPAWVEAFNAVDALEERERGGAFETGRRVARWLDKSTTRKRRRG